MMYPTAIRASVYWLLGKGDLGSRKCREVGRDGFPLDPVKSIPTVKFNWQPPTM